MKSRAEAAFKLLALAAIVAALPTVLAHGGDHDDGGMDMGGDADMNMGGADEAANVEADPSQMSYFTYAEHTTAIYAHIALMVIGWVVLLPIGKKAFLPKALLLVSTKADNWTSAAVMFSIARSRYTLPTQFVFLATNAIGVVVGTVYNAKTPDLYPNNAHHKLGWLVTWVVCAQVMIGLIGRVAGVLGSRGAGGFSKEEQQGFIPVSTEAMAEHEHHHRMNGEGFVQQPYRHSQDSGSAHNAAESRRSDSLSTMVGQESPNEHTEQRVHFVDLEDDGDDFDYKEKMSGSKFLSNSVLAKFAGKISSRAWTVLLFGYNFVDRTILILGYIALCLGLVTYARFFVSYSNVV